MDALPELRGQRPHRIFPLCSAWTVRPPLSPYDFTLSKTLPCCAYGVLIVSSWSKHFTPSFHPEIYLFHPEKPIKYYGSVAFGAKRMAFVSPYTAKHLLTGTACCLLQGKVSDAPGLTLSNTCLSLWQGGENIPRGRRMLTELSQFTARVLGGVMHILTEQM